MMFAACWLGSLLLSPSCRPQFWVNKAVFDFVGMLIASPLAAWLLALNVARAGTPVKLKATFWRVVAIGMLLAGTAGAITSLSCKPLESAWPTPEFYAVFANVSQWKVLGQWLMVVGFVGLLAVSAKPKTAKPRP